MTPALLRALLALLITIGASASIVAAGTDTGSAVPRTRDVAPNRHCSRFPNGIWYIVRRNTRVSCKTSLRMHFRS